MNFIAGGQGGRFRPVYGVPSGGGIRVSSLRRRLTLALFMLFPPGGGDGFRRCGDDLLSPVNGVPSGGPILSLVGKNGGRKDTRGKPFRRGFPLEPLSTPTKVGRLPPLETPAWGAFRVLFSPLLPRRVACAWQRSPGFLDSAGKAFAVFPSAAPALRLSGAGAHAAAFVRGSCPRCFLDRAPMRGYPEGANGPLWSVRGDPQGGHSRKCPPCARLCILSARSESMPPEDTDARHRAGPPEDTDERHRTLPPGGYRQKTQTPPPEGTNGSNSTWPPEETP